MTYKVYHTSRFRKDIKKAKKQHRNVELLFAIIDQLMRGETLASQYHAHPLQGEYKGYWDCHVTGDWVLIYRYDNINHYLELVRIGSHAELFG